MSDTGLVSAPPGLDTPGRIEFLQQGRQLFAISYSLGYLVFGISLAISLQALQQAIPDKQAALVGLADRFGWIWGTLLIGTLGILSVLHTVPYLTDAFGLLQIIWFSWLGMLLFRTKF